MRQKSSLFYLSRCYPPLFVLVARIGTGAWRAGQGGGR
jgi:hypothetical protein